MHWSRHARWEQVARCALGSLAAWCKYNTRDVKKVAARSYSPGCYLLLYEIQLWNIKGKRRVVKLKL